MLLGATAGVKGYVLEMADRVVRRAGVRVGVVSSGYRPGSRTVNGHLSLHSRRQAVDITARGDALVRLGQAALAEAGGDSTARKFAGTVNGWEIAFGGDFPGYGDHTDHLHLGWEGAGVPRGSVGGIAPQAHYTFNELMEVWLVAGGAREHAAMAAQVASLESGGDPHAHAFTRREDSRGLWQINVRANAHPEYANAALYDPATNARAAIAISRNGTQWSQWSTAATARIRIAGRGAVKIPNVGRPGGAPQSEAELRAQAGLPGKNWTDSIAGGATGAIEGIGDWAKALVTLIAFLVSPTNWLRLVEFVAGFSLLLLGFGMLGVELAKSGSAASGAARGAVSLAQRFTPTGRLARYYGRRGGSRGPSGYRAPRRKATDPLPARPSQGSRTGSGDDIPF